MAGVRPGHVPCGSGDGASLMLKVFADEDRDRARLQRFYHSVMMRHAQDDHAATTQSTAEHAVLAMVTAARAGARVPEPVLA